MRVTVCEMSGHPARIEGDWQRIVDHTRAEDPELMVFTSPQQPAVTVDLNLG